MKKNGRRGQLSAPPVDRSASVRVTRRTPDCNKSDFLSLHSLSHFLPSLDVCVRPVYNIFMKTTIDTIIAEVLSLSPQARAFVAEKLIESLDSEPAVTLSAAWQDEVRKRCREIDEGTVELRDAVDVFVRGYAALG